MDMDICLIRIKWDVKLSILHIHVFTRYASAMITSPPEGEGEVL